MGPCPVLMFASKKIKALGREARGAKNEGLERRSKGSKKGGKIDEKKWGRGE
jgi:hypothetical protein